MTDIPANWQLDVRTMKPSVSLLRGPICVFCDLLLVC